MAGEENEMDLTEFEKIQKEIGRIHGEIGRENQQLMDHLQNGFQNRHFQESFRQKMLLEIQLFSLHNKLPSEYFALYKEAQNDKRELVSKTKDALKFAQQAESTASKALETATNAAGIAAAKPLIEHFDHRVKELSKPFWIWLGVTVVLFLGLILSLVLSQFYVKDLVSSIKAEEHVFASAIFISNKVILITVLLSFTFWCAKFFKDTYQKLSLYKHKLVLTKTYQAFMLSSENENVKNAILQEAVKNIFAPLPDNDHSQKVELDIFNHASKAINQGAKNS